MSKWSYDRPTEPGWYWVNYGDVVNGDLLSAYQLINIAGREGLYDRKAYYEGHAIECIDDWHKQFKFLKIDIEALNQIGTES